MEQLSFDDVEIWRPVVGLEDRYEVSNLGPVRSLYRNSLRILSPSYANSGGYPLYILMKNGVRYPRYGHHLVAEAFIGERPEGAEVRHVNDPNPANCALTNLAYGTSGDNKDDQVRHGTHPEGCKDSCDNGHEFTPENTRIDYWPDGTFRERICRACNRDRATEQRAKRKADDRRCKEEGCDKPYFGRGWCSKHYGDWWREQPGNRERSAAATRRSYAKKVR